MTMNPLALLRAVLAAIAATSATAATLRDFREEPAPNADAPGPAADGRDVEGLRDFPEEPAPNADAPGPAADGRDVEGLPAALGADPQDVPHAPEDALTAKFAPMGVASVIDLYFSDDVDNSETNDAPNLKIRWESSGGSHISDLGRMDCGELMVDRMGRTRTYRCRSSAIFSDLATAIDYIEVEATGGDAILIDHANFSFKRPSHSERFKQWGTPSNQYGWCVSTESNDFDGNQYRPASACRCRYQFHWDNTNSAYWGACSGTEEGRLAVEPGR